MELGLLEERGVRGLLVKTGPGKLSAQLRCGYAFAMDQGYEGVVTIDGNDKDDPEAIPRFVAAHGNLIRHCTALHAMATARSEPPPSDRKGDKR